MRRFWFNGRCSTEFGMVATGSGTFDGAERDLKFESVAGRNGDLVIDNGRYKNKRVPYPVFINHNFAKNAEAARAWLKGSGAYCRLEDEYNPDTFRMAIFQGPMDFDVKFLNRIGETTLYFNCKPQRFLRTGEMPVSLSTSGVLHNITDFPAKPLITIHGTEAGTLTIGSYTVEVLEISDEITLDCEMMNAYRKTGDGPAENRNSAIRAYEFPELMPGDNAISWTGGITGVDIIPRWWTL